MSSSGKALSALVCTYNRADLLRGTLESLCRQTLPAAQFEVVVVDDGSSDDTATVVAEFAGRLPLVHGTQRNAGLASARNHALYLATGALVLMMDDDDLAERDLLARHVEAHRLHASPHVAVLGFTRLAPEIADDPLMHFVTEVGHFLFSYGAVKPGVALDFSHFWGGRASAKRAFLMDHGVFDPVFRFGCEDIELAWRLSRHGLQVFYEPRAVSVMVRPYDFDGFCRRLHRQGQSQLVFARMHPDPAVQGWCEMDGAAARWQAVAPHHQRLLETGRRLDRLVRRRAAAGVSSDSLDLALLHAAYWAAFRASKLKGIVDKAAELDGLDRVDPPAPGSFAESPTSSPVLEPMTARLA